MKGRSLAAVFFLPFVTLNIYGIVWFVKTKNEMNRSGAHIPTAWLLIVPIVSIYWLWKYSEGVETVTGAKMSTPLAFVLLFLLGVIGNTIIQSEFNDVANGTSSAPVNPVAPVNSAVTPQQFAPQPPVTPVTPVQSRQPQSPEVPEAPQPPINPAV